MNGNRSKGIICKSKEEEDGVWDWKRKMNN
jgi:hypothetical protein